MSAKSSSSFWNIEVSANNYTTSILDPYGNEILHLTKAELSINGSLSTQSIWARVMVNVTCKSQYDEREIWIAGNSQICYLTTQYGLHSQNLDFLFDPLLINNKDCHSYVDVPAFLMLTFWQESSPFENEIPVMLSGYVTNRYQKVTVENDDSIKVHMYSAANNPIYVKQTQNDGSIQGKESIFKGPYQVFLSLLSLIMAGVFIGNIMLFIVGLCLYSKLSQIKVP